MRMSKETLKQYLQNKPLVEAIRQQTTIDETRLKLHGSLQLLHDTGVHEADEAIEAKLDEYAKASRAYEAMIKDAWGLNWLRAVIVSKYLDRDINDLPGYVDE